MRSPWPTGAVVPKTNKATKISVPHVITITITLHCRDVNTSLFQKEKEKELDP
jgi:hypothetical protein